jgi:hypothetical protein
VAAISLLFAGLGRVGPTTASILATVEPVVTVLLAFLVFGETLGTSQLAGGACVVAAVLALSRPGRRSRRAGPRGRHPDGDGRLALRRSAHTAAEHQVRRVHAGVEPHRAGDEAAVPALAARLERV